MNLKSIKVGRWYETKFGTGECVRSGGTFPASVRVRIDSPLPRGFVVLTPREVLLEVPAPAVKSE